MKELVKTRIVLKKCLSILMNLEFIFLVLFRINVLFQNHRPMKLPIWCCENLATVSLNSRGHFSFHPADSAIMTWCRGICKDSSRKGKAEQGSRAPFHEDRSLQPFLCKHIVFSTSLGFKEEVQNIKLNKNQRKLFLLSSERGGQWH